MFTLIEEKASLKGGSRVLTKVKNVLAERGLLGGENRTHNLGRFKV